MRLASRQPRNRIMLFFGVVTITNLKLEICGEIPTEIPVSFWQLCEVCRTIKQPHTIVLLILNAKNDLEDVILLKNHEALLCTLSLLPLGAFYSFINGQNCQSAYFVSISLN